MQHNIIIPLTFNVEDLNKQCGHYDKHFYFNMANYNIKTKVISQLPICKHG